MSARTRKSDAIRASTELVEIRAMCPAVLRAASGPRKFEVVVLASGFGANSEQGRQWFVPDTDEGLGSAVKVFGGAKVHWARGTSAQYDHRSDDSPLARWLDDGHEVGYLSDVRRVEGSLVAMLNVADDVPAEVLEVIAARRVGLSIEAAADRRPAIRDGKAVVELINFRHGAEQASVAVVSHPALAGEILRVAASRRSPTMNLVQALAILASVTASAAEKLTAARFVAADATATPEQLADAGRILASAPPPHPAPTATLTAEAEARIKAAQEKLDATLLETDIRTAHNVALGLVQAAKLPPKSHVAVMASIDAEIRASADVRKDPTTFTTKAIDAKRAELAEVDVRVLGAGSSGQVGIGERDRHTLLIDRMILGNQFDIRAARVDQFLAKQHGGKTLAEREAAAGIPVAPFMGPRRALTLITGTDPVDWRSGGYFGRAEQIRASVGATAMADMWADRMHKIALAYFETSDYRTNVRKMAKVISVSDFRNVDFVALGAYGNLAAVPKGSDYQAISTPSSQGHEFTISKYGGTETIDWEDIVNDDMQVVQQTPRRLEDAYSRTLFEAVADKYLISNLTTDTTDYDSTAWCTTSRTPDNFNTTAFSATELKAVIKLMYAATDFFNGKRLALRPKYILHPIELEADVRDTLIAAPSERPGITTDYSYAQSLGIEPILIPGWTNAKDHVYIVDPNGPCPSQVLAFLNGQEAPTIDVQDMRNAGSWFDKDSMTMKISGVWGNDLVRHEGIFAEDVA